LPDGTISLQIGPEPGAVDLHHTDFFLMPLQLKIISNHRDIVGDDYVRHFSERGGTIGRALDNDWILPDPDRFISGKHATVDYQSGAFYLADVSSNGVYINGESDPIGRGNPRRLFDGDQIRMGDFEFEVTIDEGQGLEMPPPEPMSVVPDHIEQLVDEDAPKTGIQLLDEESITGDEAFQSTLFGGPVNDAAGENAGAPDKRPARKTQEANPFAAKADDPEPLAVEELLDSFLHGVGIDRSEIHPSTDPNEVMENAGLVLRELIAGISELLVSRANLKSMFRLDQTTILPRHNNPLKLAENTSDALKQLLVGKEGEYLGPLDAVKEVCCDLKFHQDALFEGMVGAFSDFSDRFDPDELQVNFDRTLNRKPLFAALNQLKYWQLYGEVYPIMTQSGSGKFPHHFGEDFVRAYEKQIYEYKRLDRGDDDLAARRKAKAKVATEAAGELTDQVDHGTEY
jgi:predicted component of type VI protein secretion system